MAILAPRDERLLRVAIVASLAFHVLAAALMPQVANVAFDAPDFETIDVRLLPRIETSRLAPQHAAPAAAPVHAAVVRTVSREHAQAARPEPVHTQPPASAERAHAPVAGATRTGSAVAATATNPPAARATVQPDPPAVPQRNAGGDMPLGAEQPDPVLDPGIRRSLASLGVHVTLVVTVDAGGHTERVVFRPALDEALEAQIRTLLASAAWDPAVCGAGVPCEGTATIAL
jgi:hypothetical protein